MVSGEYSIAATMLTEGMRLLVLALCLILFTLVNTVEAMHKLDVFINLLFLFLFRSFSSKRRSGHFLTLGFEPTRKISASGKI